MRREPSFEPAWTDDDIRPLGRPRPFARLWFAARFVTAAALVAGLTVAARDKLKPSAPPRAWAEPTYATGPEHVASDAGPVLSLASGASETPIRAEPPRWNASTGVREDALIGGGFAAIEAPFLRIDLGEVQPGTEPPGSLFVTLARRAAEVQGLSVARTGLRGRIASKFGTLETVETVLAGEGSRSCLGFQSLDTRRLRLDGWLCGILGQAPEPRELACLIDRLTLSGGAAPTLETAFAEAETHRDAGCAGPNVVGSRDADKTGSIVRKDAAKGRSR